MSDADRRRAEEHARQWHDHHGLRVCHFCDCVEAAYLAGLSAERERCAKMLETERDCWTEDVVIEVLNTMAAHIRKES